jgi:ABC-type uncharacterized transport system substrate-binding protein
MSIRKLSVLSLFFVLLLAHGLTIPVYSRPAKSTALIYDASSKLHQQVVSGIRKAFDGRKEIKPLFLEIDINESDSVNKLKSENISHAISIGVEPAQFVLKHHLPFPVLHTMMPKTTYENLLKKVPATERGHLSRHYVIYLGQKPSRIVMLSKLLNTSVKTVGMVAGDYSIYEAEAVKRVAEAEDISVMLSKSTNVDNVMNDFRRVLQESDSYLALYDPEVLNSHNAKWLLYMAYKLKKPVIGFSPSYTSAGAVASIFSSPEQFAEQSAEWLINMINENPVSHRQYPKYFSVTTNPDIQQYIGIEKQSAQKLKKLLLDHERGGAND